MKREELVKAKNEADKEDKKYHSVWGDILEALDERKEADKALRQFNKENER